MNLPGKGTLSWTLPGGREQQSVAPPVQADAQETGQAETAIADRRMTPHPEEAEWVRRARLGEIVAFDWLMTRYRDRAVRLAAHILRRPSEAEDVAQEAFLRAFAQIGRFRGDASFFTWLYRIIARLCLNRKLTPWWRQELDPMEAHDARWEAEPSGDAATTDRLLIESLMDSLPPALRATLALRELEGLDYAEIAETLDIPVGTVRSRLNAARAQFRTLWQRAQEEANDV